MRTRLVPGVTKAALLAAAVSVSGCNVLNPESCQEAAATIQPLEPTMLPTTYLEWPTSVTTAVVIRPGPYEGHYSSQARGYVLAPLAKVYEALKDPAATYIRNQPGTPNWTNLDIPTQTIVDPLSVSSVAFRVFYKNDTGVVAVPVVKFDVITRLGWLQGSEANPIELGLRSHKTCGTTHIQLMAGSITARAVPALSLPSGVTDATALELIYFLAADTQGQSNCDGTLQDHWDEIVAKLQSMP